MQSQGLKWYPDLRRMKLFRGLTKLDTSWTISSSDSAQIRAPSSTNVGVDRLEGSTSTYQLSIRSACWSANTACHEHKAGLHRLF
jgi:cysteine sulfinate desulfinase/cysteine desulfurase-like protein